MATITNVNPDAGFFAPNTSFTVTGTGFGASEGTLLLVVPELGIIVPQSIDNWADTAINSTFPTLENMLNSFPTLFDVPTRLFFVSVIPVGAATGPRSAYYNLTLDPTPITVFPNETLVLGGPSSIYGEGNDPVIPLRNFGGPVGTIQSFDNPGYGIDWIILSADAPFPGLGKYTVLGSGSNQQDIAPLGPLQFRTLVRIGQNPVPTILLID